MPRIPDTELQRLKDEVSVQTLVQASGVELRKSGRDWLGRCPFHDDREASLVVSPAKWAATVSPDGSDNYKAAANSSNWTGLR